MRPRGLDLLVAACLLSAGCGHGRVGAPAPAAPDEAWTLVVGVPFVPQRVEGEGGAAALAMVLGKGGRPTRVEDVSAALPPAVVRGVGVGQLRDLARRLGFEAYQSSGTLADLEMEIGRDHPVVVGLVELVGDTKASHFEVVVGLRRDGAKVRTMDPASGPRERPLATFLAEWDRSSRAAVVVWRGDRSLRK